MYSYDLDSCTFQMKNVGSGILLLVSKGEHVFYKKLVTCEQLSNAENEYVKEIQENKSTMRPHEEHEEPLSSDQIV